MDESAQQAISIGVNVTIFVVALSISLNLIFSVRNLADVAKKVNDSVADGSKQEAVQKHNERIITGYELLSYYYNYIVSYYESASEAVYNHPKVNIRIDSDGNGSFEVYRESNTNLDVEVDSQYKLSVEKYNEENGMTDIIIQKVS